MRHWLLIFLVVLLPLRGLAGAAMAGQMLQHPAAAQAAAGVPAHHAGGHDCDEHLAAHPAAAASGDAAQAEAPADCPTCASCQVCSAVALQPAVQPPPAVQVAQAAPHAPQRAYPSAEPALAFKPPKG